MPLTAGQSVAAATDVIVCEWNDLDQLATVLASNDVACVLMEAVMCNVGLIAPAAGYLEGVKALCARHGSLLVIDEVITGFRLGLTGAQGFLGINGDISIYAKAIASGFPLAVLGTTSDLLAPVGRGEVNHSGTYNTGVSSVAAGVATLRCLIDTDPYPEMERPDAGHLQVKYRMDQPVARVNGLNISSREDSAPLQLQISKQHVLVDALADDELVLTLDARTREHGKGAGERVLVDGRRGRGPEQYPDVKA